LQPLQEIRLPKAVTEVGSAEWGYALGCRDGGLYLFNASGKALLTHRLPRRRGDDDNTGAYPYFVRCTAGLNRVVYASWETVRCIDEHGKVHWEWALATREESSDMGHGLTLRVSLDPG